MITPRQTFKENPDLAKRWLDVVDGVQFQSAVNAALLEMALRNSNPPDMGTAASYAYRMEGAKQFLRILMGLTLSDEKRPEPLPQNLDHRI